MAIKGIIFDLDGTLIDTLDDLADAMNAALDKNHCPMRSGPECQQMIGSGLVKFAQRAVPDDKQHLIDQVLTDMIEYYQRHCLSKTIVYDGLMDVIVTLLSRNIQLAVLTNKNQKPTDVLVDHYFPSDTFHPVIGVSEGIKVKPDPACVFGIMADWKMTPDEVLYIGDSDVDVETARNAQIRCLACLWGFRSKEQLIAAGAEELIEHPSQILDAIE